MLQRFFSAFTVLVFLLALTSCVAIDDRTQDIQQPGAVTDLERFPEWKPGNTMADSAGKNKAVTELLQQADMLIAENQMEQASDKLERLLRIQPSSAKAWSRLAWVALQSSQPARTQQMAHRSNSYAYDDNKLKILNWFFIREAGLQTGDDTAIWQAETMIKSLGGSLDEF